MLPPASASPSLVSNTRWNVQQLLRSFKRMEQVISHLETLLNREPESLFINLEGLSINDAIAFAGFLLEYPVSYLPEDMSEEGSTKSLNGVPLRLFDCYLVSEDPGCKASRCAVPDMAGIG